MPITDADREKLTEFLDENRGDARGQSQTPPDLDPVTDHSTAIVCTGGAGTTGHYHANAGGEPACDSRKSETSQFFEWDIETAREWRPPCSMCFPEGDPATDANGGER